MKKKINHKIKSLSIELDKNTQLKELNGIIKNFKETTNDKFEVNIIFFSYRTNFRFFDIVIDMCLY